VQKGASVGTQEVDCESHNVVRARHWCGSRYVLVTVVVCAGGLLAKGALKGFINIGVS
jgi:hypothetical protein